MGRIEFTHGDMNITLEIGDDALVREFEKVFTLPTGQTVTAKKEVPIREPKISETHSETNVEKPEPAKPDISFEQHLEGFKKLTRTQTILAFAEWFGKPFTGKDYYPFAKTESDTKDFHIKITALRKSGYLEIVSRGVYSITNQGIETLKKKRKK